MSEKKVENFDTNLPVENSNSISVLFRRMIDRIKTKISAIAKSIKEANKPIEESGKYRANPAKPMGTKFAENLLDICRQDAKSEVGNEMDKVVKEQRRDQIAEDLRKGKEASMTLSELGRVVAKIAHDVDGNKPKQEPKAKQEIVFDQPETFGPSDDFIEKYQDYPVNDKPNRSRRYPRGTREDPDR